MGAEQLCLECGLCCQGVIFSGVGLLPNEVGLAKKLRLDIVEIPGGHAFRQPCPRQEGVACTVYDERPDHCRKFECKTLKSFLVDEISLDESLQKLRAIVDLKKQIEARLAPGQNVGYFWNYMALLADPAVHPSQRTLIEEMFPAVIADAHRLRKMVEADLHSGK